MMETKRLRTNSEPTTMKTMKKKDQPRLLSYYGL